MPQPAAPLTAAELVPAILHMGLPDMGCPARTHLSSPALRRHSGFGYSVGNPQPGRPFRHSHSWPRSGPARNPQLSRAIGTIWPGDRGLASRAAKYWHCCTPDVVHPLVLGEEDRWISLDEYQRSRAGQERASHLRTSRTAVSRGWALSGQARAQPLFTKWWIEGGARLRFFIAPFEGPLKLWDTLHSPVHPQRVPGRQYSTVFSAKAARTRGSLCWSGLKVTARAGCDCQPDP